MTRPLTGEEILKKIKWMAEYGLKNELVVSQPRAIYDVLKDYFAGRLTK